MRVIIWDLLVNTNSCGISTSLILLDAIDFESEQKHFIKSARYYCQSVATMKIINSKCSTQAWIIKISSITLAKNFTELFTKNFNLKCRTSLHIFTFISFRRCITLIYYTIAKWVLRESFSMFAKRIYSRWNNFSYVTPITHWIQQKLLSFSKVEKYFHATRENFKFTSFLTNGRINSENNSL